MAADTSEWSWPILLSAGLAALGFVGKQLAEWIGETRAAERTRRSRLAELLALIRAGDTAFKIQSENRDRLKELVEARDPALAAAGHGYDRLFALAFPSMSVAERELHDVIRAITIHTFKPLNDDLLEWLRADTDFRVRPPGSDPRSELAQYLADLEAHLLLWRAKYQAWLPDHPERALVYLADEERHGVGFPGDGAKLVARVLHSQQWIDA